MVPLTERIERRGPTLLWAVAASARDRRVRSVALVLAHVRCLALTGAPTP
jgi:hypothetical protein